MDFQYAPILKISEKERLKNEAFLREVVRRSDESGQNTVAMLKKAGYTDEEIDLIFEA